MKKQWEEPEITLEERLPSRRDEGAGYLINFDHLVEIEDMDEWAAADIDADEPQAPRTRASGPRIEGEFRGEVLLQLREERGLSRTALERAVGVSKSSVSSWERGSYKPNLRCAERMAEFLGVSLGELVA